MKKFTPFENSKKLLAEIKANEVKKKEQLEQLQKDKADKEVPVSQLEAEYKDLIVNGKVQEAMQLEPQIQDFKQEIQSIVNAMNVISAVSTNNNLNQQLIKAKENDIEEIQNYVDDVRQQLYKAKLKYLIELQKFVEFNEAIQVHCRELNVNVSIFHPELNLKEKYLAVDFNLLLTREAFKNLDKQIELYTTITERGGK